MSTRSYLVSGAGSGIGRAVALRIARAAPEHRVVLLGRTKERLDEVRRELPDPGFHQVLVADIRDKEMLRHVVQGARLQDTNLVAVIANAGVGGENHYGPNDRWDEIIQTNLGGTYHLVQECLPALRDSQEQYRHIVMTSSVLARLGVPNYSAYCASKAGLLGLMRSWAAELARERILVNAICPGWVETDMSKAGLEDLARSVGTSVQEVRRLEMDRVPLTKMSAPSEVAELIQFLVSGLQVSITGQALDINGGAVMA